MKFVMFFVKKTYYFSRELIMKIIYQITVNVTVSGEAVEKQQNL